MTTNSSTPSQSSPNAYHSPLAAHVHQPRPGGRTLAEIRDAVGHSSVLVTSAYLHVAVEDDGAVGSLFRVR